MHFHCFICHSALKKPPHPTRMTANGNVVYGLSPCKRPCSATQWGAEVAQNHAVPHNKLTSRGLRLHTGNQRISRQPFFIRKQRNLKPPYEIRMKANQPRRRQYDTRQKNRPVLNLGVKVFTATGRQRRPTFLNRMWSEAQLAVSDGHKHRPRIGRTAFTVVRF